MKNGHRFALVTGGAGFIGSHLVHGLLARGYAVRVIDNLSGPKSWRRLADVSDKVECIEADIRDETALRSAMENVDVIFHKAALVSVPESVAHPMQYHETDATATLSLLECARRSNVSRIIYASTSAIYGDAPEQPKTESMRGVPMSPYGIAKYAGELYMTAYAKLHGLQTISLRYFNVFGSQQDPKSQYGAAVPSIVSKILAGESPTIFGDGEQTRDFCHVSNIVHANLLAAESKSLNGEVINIGCGKSVSVNRIVQVVNESLGTKVKVTLAPPRDGDVKHSLADISLAREVIGYEPVTYFDEGLKASIEWYAKNVDRRWLTGLVWKPMFC